MDSSQLARRRQSVTCGTNGFRDAEKKGTGQLFCEPVEGTCSGVLAYAAANTAEKKGTGQLFCEPIEGTCSGVLAYAAANTIACLCIGTVLCCRLSSTHTLA
jgi:hypothetical protein